MAAGGLRNEDFRKLLATPRPGARGGGGGEGGEAEKQKKAKKPGPNFRRGGKPGAKEGEEDEGNKYRCAQGRCSSRRYSAHCSLLTEMQQQPHTTKPPSAALPPPPALQGPRR